MRSKTEDDLRGFSLNWDIMYKLRIWKTGQESWLQTILYYFINSINLITCWIVVCEFLDLYDIFPNVEKICFSMCVTGVVVMSLIKHTFLWFKTNKIHEFIANSRWFYTQRLNNPEYDLTELRSRSKFMTRFTNLTMPCVLFILLCFCMLPFFIKSKRRTFPSPGRFPEVLYVTPYYEYFFVFVCYIAYYTVPTQVLGDLLIAGFLLETQTQFEILIKRIRGSEALHATTEEKKAQATKVVNSVAAEHQFLLRQIELINEIHSVNFMIQIGLVIFIYCGLAFSFVVLDIQIDMITMGEAMYGLVGLGDFFGTCVLSQMLQDESLNLVDALYETNWMSLDKPTQRTIMIVMERAQHPTTLNIGGIYVACNHSMLEVMRMTFNMLAVFREVYVIDEDKPRIEH